MKGTPPTAAFLVRHPAHFIALGFGAGLAPVAPGTFGTAVAIPLAFLLARAGDAGYAIGTLLLFAAGVWASSVTARDLGVPDHGAIVIDEVAAFLAVLFFTGLAPQSIVLAFLLFRFFDVVKLPPARAIDRAWHGGLGTMLDDAVAAGYALVAFALLVRAAAALGVAL
ncbi:MAG TPA: phosphatidylglycerophosphatase A [Casimicrobiaceae bacterium]|nr:phosphatidylglycerophosphatase A [Casimicrobiaceae bacterium]